MGASISIAKGFFSLFILSVILHGCNGSKPEYLTLDNPDGTKVFKKRNEIFKDYALCKCIHTFLKNDGAVFQDNSLETLYDLSYDHLIIDKKGQIIDSFVINYINNYLIHTGETFENRKSPFFDCLTMYKSNRLEKFVDSLLRKNKSLK